MPRTAVSLAATLIVSMCSCTSAPRVARIDDPAPNLRSQTPDGSEAPRRGIARLGARPSSKSLASNAPSSNITQTAATFTPAEPRSPANESAVAPADDRTAGHFHRRDTQRDGTRYYSAEPRGPSDAPCDMSGACPPDAPCGRSSLGPVGPMPSPYAGYAPALPVRAPVPPMSYPKLYPDEYLCDGGDRALPVHYDDYNRLGLDTEDTVAEYVDSDGTFRMKPSTRVCIYAPRFGAMRTATQPEAGTAINRLASAHETTIGAGFRNRDAVNYHEQRQGSEGMLVRARPSGLDTEYIGRGAHQNVSAIQHDKLVNTFEDYMFVRRGEIETGEEPWLAKGVQAAMVWTRNENPVIVANTVGGQEVRGKFRAAEMIGTKFEGKKGQLRIVKLADRKVAVPGDIVTFTIRYDNLGDLDVTEVRIVDNLTPRLEYVMDSGTSDRAGEITVEDNTEGSSVLTIELDEPVKGRTGGVITFQAKVR